MTTSNRLGITELAETQNSRSVTINEAIAKLEAGATFFAAIQVLVNAPPASPVEGDLYVVGTAGSGAWSGHNENVAVYYNAAWLFFVPFEGMFAWDQTSNTLKRYDGADWVAYTIGAGGISDGDYGDITVSSSGSVWTIDSGALTALEVSFGPTGLLHTTATDVQNALADLDSAITSAAVSDGDKGDITVSSSGTVWSVDVFSGAAAGNILYYDSNSPAGWQKLAPGTSGQFLQTLGSAAPAWANVPYDLPLSFAGTPTAGQLMGKLVVVRDVVLGANFTGSVGHVGTNPGATFDIDVKDNGSTIGTISVSTGGVFTFTTTSGTAKTITSGHRIEWYAPANSPAEATVANIAATLKGTAI